MVSAKQRARRKRRVRASSLLTFRVTPTNGLRPTESVRTRPNTRLYAITTARSYTSETDQ